MNEMSFEFDSDGFLTNRTDTLEVVINRVHKYLLELGRQINRDCHELIYAADVRALQGILVTTLFMRALEHYQATLILLGKGLIASARVAFRAMLESVFVARAVAADEEMLRAYVNSDFIQRRKLIRKAQLHDYPNFEDLREALTNTEDDIVTCIEDTIKFSGTKQLKIEELSKSAGMHDWYTTIYPMLSKATHTTVRDLEGYLSLNEARELQSLVYGPSTEEIPHLLLHAAHCILLAADAVAGTFKIDFQSKRDEHLKVIEAGINSLNEAYSSSY